MSKPLVAVISFALGAASAAVVDPVEVRKKVRPFVRNTLKASISMGREVRRRAARFVEDLDDLIAEAMADEAQERGAEQDSTPPRE